MNLSIADIFTARKLATCGLVIAGMMTVDPVLSTVEHWISPSHAQAMQNSPIYRSLVSATVVLVAQVAAEKLV